jgi:ribosomal protein S18 acetylase RimI-like enzyme
MIFEERTSENIHVYSLEVHPNNRCESVGRKMIDRLKEDHNYIDLTTLPESKIFYEKRRFVEEEDGHMVWRKPRLT